MRLTHGHTAQLTQTTITIGRIRTGTAPLFCISLKHIHTYTYTRHAQSHTNTHTCVHTWGLYCTLYSAEKKYIHIRIYKYIIKYKLYVKKIDSTFVCKHMRARGFYYYYWFAPNAFTFDFVCGAWGQIIVHVICEIIVYKNKNQQ